jgi:hypothetical protein
MDAYADYKFTQDVGYDEVLELYTAGYALSMASTAYSTDTIRDGAEEDLRSFLVRLDEQAEEAGWDRGYDEAVENEKAEVKRLRERNEELEELLAKSERPTVDALSRFMSQLLITTPTPVDDVEQWAFQDGHNGAIQQIIDEFALIESSVTPASE